MEGDALGEEHAAAHGAEDVRDAEGAEGGGGLGGGEVADVDSGDDFGRGEDAVHDGAVGVVSRGGRRRVV